MPKLMIQALHSTYHNDSIILRVVDQNEIDVTITQRIISLELINEKLNIIDNLDHIFQMVGESIAQQIPIALCFKPEGSIDIRPIAGYAIPKIIDQKDDQTRLFQG